MNPEVQYRLTEARRAAHSISKDGGRAALTQALIAMADAIAIVADTPRAATREESSIRAQAALPQDVVETSETTGELMIPDITMLIMKLQRIPKQYGIEESDINFLKAVGQKLGRV